MTTACHEGAILITGATGFIGRHVARRLYRTGCNVVELARDHGGITAPRRIERALQIFDSDGRLEVIHSDLSQPGAGLCQSDVARLRRTVRSVIHCAGDASFFPQSIDVSFTRALDRRTPDLARGARRQSGLKGGTFHLGASSPPTQQAVLQMINSRFGVTGFRLIDTHCESLEDPSATLPSRMAPPRLMHVVLGKDNGAAIVGHILEAHVWPTLEVVLTESPSHLCRRTDEETGLALIDVSKVGSE